jgi:hypothetical protein
MNPTSFLHRAILALALFTVFAYAALKTSAETCPAPATGACSTTTSESDCPCAPDGGYKGCTGLSEAVCPTKFGHKVEKRYWSCASGASSSICLDDTTQLCWAEYACHYTKNGCDRNENAGMTDNSYRNQKKQEKCKS